MSEEPQDTDWAYAAGFIDGEGCIAVVRAFVPARGKFSYGVAVVVVNRDRQVLEWFRDKWSGLVVGHAAGGHGPNTRETWNWRAPSGTSVEGFLRGIRPWLRIKTKQCDNALEMITLLRRSRRTLGPYPMPTEWLQEQERLYWIQRELNHRGNGPFVKEPMHSPRQIKRARAIAEYTGV